jgi:hypothetical protein
MPALRQAEMVSTERDLGPSVPTILVMAGKKFCRHDPIKPKVKTIPPPELTTNLTKEKRQVLTVLDGSRMEAIRMGSSSRRFVESILAPSRRASDQIGRRDSRTCSSSSSPRKRSAARRWGRMAGTQVER